MCLDNKMPIFTPYFRQQYRDKKLIGVPGTREKTTKH